MTDTLTPPSADGIILTDAAAAKVKALLDQEGRDDLALRLAVQPGGCSGLRYQLFFDERQLDGDVVKTYGGVNVVTDKMSAPYLSGATIGDSDFVDFVAALFAQHDVPPALVCFEITETSAISNLDEAQTFIARLREIGCRDRKSVV